MTNDSQRDKKLEEFLSYQRHTFTLNFVMDVIKNCITCGIVMAAGWYLMFHTGRLGVAHAAGLSIVLIGFFLLCLNMLQFAFVGMKGWSKSKVLIAVAGGVITMLILLSIGITVFSMQISNMLTT